MSKEIGKKSGNDSLAILQKTHAEQDYSMMEKRRYDVSGATAIPAINRIHHKVYLSLVQDCPLPSTLTRKVGWRPASAFHPNCYGHINDHINLVCSACYLDREDPQNHPKRFLHCQKVISFTQASRCSSPLALLKAAEKSGRGRDFQPAHAKLLEGPCRPWPLRMKVLGRASTLPPGQTKGGLPSGHGRPGTFNVPGCPCSTWTAQGPPCLAPLDLLGDRP